MGGAISARYLERWPNDIQAAVLSSPMMGINLGGLPKWLAKGLAATIGTVGGWVGEPPYGPGQGPYEDHGFADNELTHSTARYQAFRQIYEQHPQVRLGGATAHWIQLTSTFKIFLANETISAFGAQAVMKSDEVVMLIPYMDRVKNEPIFRPVAPGSEPSAPATLRKIGYTMPPERAVFDGVAGLSNKSVSAALYTNPKADLPNRPIMM